MEFHEYQFQGQQYRISIQATNGNYTLQRHMMSTLGTDTWETVVNGTSTRENAVQYGIGHMREPVRRTDVEPGIQQQRVEFRTNVYTNADHQYRIYPDFTGLQVNEHGAWRDVLAGSARMRQVTEYVRSTPTIFTTLTEASQPTYQQFTYRGGNYRTVIERGAADYHIERDFNNDSNWRRMQPGRISQSLRTRAINETDVQEIMAHHQRPMTPQEASPLPNQEFQYQGHMFRIHNTEQRTLVQRRVDDYREPSGYLWMDVPSGQQDEILAFHRARALHPEGTIGTGTEFPTGPTAGAVMFYHTGQRALYHWDESTQGWVMLENATQDAQQQAEPVEIQVGYARARVHPPTRGGSRVEYQREGATDWRQVANGSRTWNRVMEEYRRWESHEAERKAGEMTDEQQLWMVDACLEGREVHARVYSSNPAEWQVEIENDGDTLALVFLTGTEGYKQFQEIMLEMNDQRTKHGVWRVLGRQYRMSPVSNNPQVRDGDRWNRLNTADSMYDRVMKYFGPKEEPMDKRKFHRDILEVAKRALGDDNACMIKDTTYMQHPGKRALGLRWPFLEMRNRSGNRHQISEMFVALPIQHGSNKFTASFLGCRLEVTRAEYDSQYQHSHISPGMGWSAFCTGADGINDIWADLNTGYADTDKDYLLKLEGFIHQLTSFLSYESLEGTPYKYMNQIGNHNRNGNYLNHQAQTQDIRRLQTEMHLKAEDMSISFVTGDCRLVESDPLHDEMASLVQNHQIRLPNGQYMNHNEQAASTEGEYMDFGIEWQGNFKQFFIKPTNVKIDGTEKKRKSVHGQIFQQYKDDLESRWTNACHAFLVEQYKASSEAEEQRYASTERRAISPDLLLLSAPVITGVERDALLADKRGRGSDKTGKRSNSR